MYIYIMHYIFLSCSIKNLTLASMSRLLPMISDVNFPVDNLQFSQWSIKAITENQSHDFLINSRDSDEKYCFYNCTL